MVDRPVMIPWRWTGHGLDVRCYLHDGEPYFNADDVCRALDVPVVRDVDALTERVTASYPCDTTILASLVDADNAHIPVMTVDQVFDLDATRPLYAEDPGFAEWFEDLLADHLTGPDIDRLVGAVLRPDEVPPLDEPTYSVGHAARILSRDPIIDIGERSLFEVMREIGWIDRDTTFTWIPAPHTLNQALLERHQVRTRGRRSLYPQIRITREGLLALQRRLGGLLELSTGNAGQVALVDVQ